MTGLTIRSRRSSAATVGDLVRRLGRGVLWLLAVMLLARGFADLLAQPEPVTSTPSQRPAAPSWPDDEARAFGAAFVREYLTVSRRDVRALAGFVSPELAESIAPELGAYPGRGVVEAVVFARSTRLEAHHALLTFAATTAAGTRYVTVPIARDDRGGLVVDELPSFAAPPGVASVAAAPPTPLVGSERDELQAIVERFLRAYVAGDAGGLAYLVPAGTQIATPAAGSFEFVELVSLSLAAPASGSRRSLLVVARVRELGSGAVFSQSYRLRLERRERWYVADVNGSREG